MTFRKIRLLAVAGIFSLLLVAAGTPPGLDAAGDAARASAAAPAQSGWVFWGCWTQFSSGTCRDIYRDPQGNYWRCRACGTTGTPNSNKCTRISSQTLDTGFWCS